MNKEVTITTTVTNCSRCPNSMAEADPDPHDWFCSDDVRIRCTIANQDNPRTLENGALCVGEPYITVACRPHHIEEECEIPDWCPLLNLT